jgi:MYND finger
MEPANSKDDGVPADAVKALSITDTEAEEKKCAVCKKPESDMSTKMKLCSRCKSVRYCSKVSNTPCIQMVSSDSEKISGMPVPRLEGAQD